MNLMEMMEKYHTDDHCREALEKIRWPDGVRCPRCESEKVWRTERDQFDCGSCGYRFSVTSGTIFHDTHLPLRKWFLATYLIVESKKGMSASQMQRTLKVSYKTAWYLCHRIRAAMRDAYPMPLKGIIEVDETYVGGKVRGKGRGYVGNKAIVVGAVQRKGKIILQVVEANDRKTLHGFIKGSSENPEAIYTDQWAAYKGIGDADTIHESVNHRDEEWVRGDVHTNSVEGVWSLLKRSIVGSFHHLSLKHLDAYLDELEWRFNNRDNPFLFRDTLRKLLLSENMEYKELIA
jgi:transposase-like protein